MYLKYLCLPRLFNFSLALWSIRSSMGSLSACLPQQCSTAPPFCWYGTLSSVALEFLLAKTQKCGFPCDFECVLCVGRTQDSLVILGHVRLKVGGNKTGPGQKRSTLSLSTQYNFWPTRDETGSQSIQRDDNIIMKDQFELLLQRPRKTKRSSA